MLDRVKEEIDGLRTVADKLLRENGALQYRVLQLASPEPKREVTNEQPVPPLYDTPPDREVNGPNP